MRACSIKYLLLSMQQGLGRPVKAENLFVSVTAGSSLPATGLDAQEVFIKHLLIGWMEHTSVVC